MRRYNKAPGAYVAARLAQARVAAVAVKKVGAGKEVEEVGSGGVLAGAYTRPLLSST